MEKFVDTDGCALHGSHPHHHHHDDVEEKSTSRAASTLFGRKSKPVSLNPSSPARKEPKRYSESSSPETVKPDVFKQETIKVDDIQHEAASTLNETSE